MSLINQMLKDLDKRKGKGGNTEATKGLSPAPSKFKRSGSLPYTILVLAVAVGAVSYWMWSQNKHLATMKSAKAQHALNLQKIIKKAQSIKPTYPQLTTSTYIEKDNTGTLTLNFNQKPHYTMAVSENDRHINLNIDKATLKGPLPDLKANQLMSSFKFVKGNTNALQIELAPNVKIKTLHATAHKPYHISLSVFAKPKALPQTPPTPIKKEIALSAEQLTQNKFNHILNTLMQHQSKTSLLILRNFANSHPDYLPAKHTLATYYAKQKNYPKALSIVNSTLQEDPNNINFVILKARILIAQDQVKSANILLSGYSPSIKKYPNFYILIAALEQQIGHYELAAQYYQELIDMDSSNGNFWLGYGLSLEQLNRNNAAIRAFKQALISEGVSPTVKAFLRTKIEQLGA